ncbi:DUF3311 domain-containing protein [Streptomyces meridianus]|uniref:DUF3311 domain-containing protein n=1 Tax=Streptomyces meridianus TaxID=2938945 RepID=A0ABT0XBX2_9ACTN|nr:DUF3311 domain-containing protein [Streptomyces meridianus]MCM2580028.1 DUF3311 domain-containing protein [Streptomyces meridianus]
MPDPTGRTGSHAAQSQLPPAALPFDELPAGSSRRSLWLLLVPAVLYGLAPLVANRIEPRVLGVPFLLAWIIGATVLSPLAIWLTARLDPAYRAGTAESLPVDRPAGPAAPARDEHHTAASEGEAR